MIQWKRQPAKPDGYYSLPQEIADRLNRAPDDIKPHVVVGPDHLGYVEERWFNLVHEFMIPSKVSRKRPPVQVFCLYNVYRRDGEVLVTYPALHDMPYYVRAFHPAVAMWSLRMGGAPCGPRATSRQWDSP